MQVSDNIMKSLFLILITSILVPVLAVAGDYTWPLPASRELTSNFCAFRGGHYHAGIDIRTFGKTGYKVVAVDDGYLWRVGSNWWGYGNVVYLKLDNGNIAVYGHLSEFTPEVEKYVRAEQHKAGRYKVNLYPEKDLFRFKKGELIGKSGQSGAGAPHLHFEIRDANNNPLHPFRFYSSVRDTRKPRFEEITFRPLKGFGNVEGAHQGYSARLRYNRDRGVYTNAKIFRMYGEVGIEIKVADYINNHSRKFNVTDIKLYLDDTLRFHSRYDSLSFSTWNLVDLDYNHYQRIKNKHYYHNLYYPDGLKSGQFRAGSDCPTCRGLTLDSTLSPGLHDLKIVATDSHGNRAKAEVKIEILPVPKLRSVFEGRNNPANFDFFTHSSYLFPARSDYRIDLLKFDPDSVGFIKFARISSEQTNAGTILPLQNVIETLEPVTGDDGFQLVRIDFADKNGIFHRELLGYYPEFHSNYIDSKHLNQIDWIESVQFYSSHPEIVCDPAGFYDFIIQNDIGISFVQPLLSGDDRLKFALRLDRPIGSFLEGFHPVPNLLNDLVIRKAASESYIYHRGNSDAEYIREGFRIRIPKSIPSDLFFSVGHFTGSSSGPSLIIQPDDRLFIENISLGIKLPNTMSAEKTGLFTIDRKGNPGFATNDLDPDGYMMADFRSFGSFQLLTDTEPPRIYSIRPKNGSYTSYSRPKIRFRIKDELAGIGSDTLVTVTLDGRWQVCELDVDNDIAYVHLDRALTPGKHELVISARDNLGNLAVRKSLFRYQPSGN
ncbi:MAG: peptidoglycan DD-metalloendopeptidase family protein [candidate division Zixibacteria bacterium]|nr:peptidoglycan DD-metalloendopeptidase family protein [candidate division Zixibacteria bacterium]